MQAIKEWLKNISQNDFDFEFLIMWAGNFNALFSLTEYIWKNSNIDFVINIWICGKKESAKKELFLAYRSKNLANERESIHPLYLDFANVESLACSEKIITSEKELWEEIYVDMESSWVEFVCNKQKLPYAIFKLPFDNVSEDSLRVDKKEIITSLANIDFEKIFFSLREFFQKNTPKVDFGDVNIWKEKFFLTFTEFEMFKKALNREIAFWKSVENIFENLKNMEKKEVQNFLKN